ncbi:MAG: RluA family pseudouridine synthase, partial [Muribaculaceae bacterium]|nr:RluA family pseudouridine synthase [Muribaculaceae bacterium]
MAEFWVGKSPQGEVRHHGHYYPACRSKCLPLMEFMLQGLDVESNPLAHTPDGEKVRVVFDDQWLIVVEKPAGMLTVSGKDEAVSLLEIVREMLPEGEEALEVHRLDQATSGLVVIAKTHKVQKLLRQQFEERKVSKTYVALLDGTPTKKEGIIELPLHPDIDDRPRQVVDMKNGKEAVTKYRVLEYRGDKTLVEFTPLTGRTHQLRVHASHPQGLNCPIVGDMLYGTADKRLYLHAKTINFTHPITGETMSFISRK